MEDTMTKTEEKTAKTILAKVNVCDLMRQAAQEMRSFPVAMGFQISVGYLGTAAQRAAEINDPIIIAVFENLGIITDDDAPGRESRQSALIEYQDKKR